MSQGAQAPQKRSHVPAEPFRQILEEDIVLYGALLTGEKIGVDESLIRKVRNGQTSIEFAVADRIVTLLRGPMLWHEDPVLREIYDSVDLRAIDWLTPVSDEVKQQLERMAIEALEQEGNQKAAAKKLGINVHTFEKRAPRSKVRAVMRAAAKASGVKPRYANPDIPWEGRVFYGGRWRTPEEVEHQRARMRKTRTAA